MSTDRIRAKQVIAEIVRQAGGTWTGNMRLYKVFYFAHLLYADRAPDYLTEWPIVRMPSGPGIDKGEALLNELVATGILATKAVNEGPYRTVQYGLTQKPAPGEPLSEVAVDAIKDAVQFVLERSAVEISDLIHEFSRAWNSARDGQLLNIYIDLIPEDEYQKRRSDLWALKREIAAARNAKDAHTHERASA